MFFANAFTSSSVMRPLGPLPVTWAMSTPISRATRRTDGDAGAAAVDGTGGAGAADGRRRLALADIHDRRPLPRAVVFGRGVGGRGFGLLRLVLLVGWRGRARFLRRGGSWSGRRRRRLGLGGRGLLCFFAAGAPPLSTTSTTWPVLTLSPGLTLISLTVPATLDGTSRVALSVSSSSTGWSSAMVSPGFTSTCSTSPCGTPSPRLGRMKSATSISSQLSAISCRMAHGSRSTAIGRLNAPIAESVRAES